MKPYVSDQLIDQLVCGSLSGDEYREAILALEAEPKRWRDCALAFLQEQAITHELKALAMSDVNWDAEPQCSFESSSNEKRLAKKSKAKSELLRSWMIRLSSLAALLMVGFGVGWICSSIRGQVAMANLKNASLPTGTLAGNVTKSNNVPDPEYRLNRMTVDQILPTPRLGSNNHSPVGNKYSSLMPIDSGIPASLAKLEREGHIRIEKSTTLVPVEYGEMTFLVPLHQLQVIPITFSY